MLNYVVPENEQSTFLPLNGLLSEIHLCLVSFKDNVLLELSIAA